MLGEVLARAISPPPDITVSEWADTHRVLSGKAAAEPGRWHTSRAPYTKEVMDTFSDPEVESTVCMWGSQLAKTEIILNVVGYFIDCDPCPIAVSQPNTKALRDFSRVRLTPMLEDSEPLKGKVADPKSRDATNTVSSKEFEGGQLYILTAESPADLSSRPVRIAISDEVDRYENTKEGDPLSLLERRTTNFWNRKLGYFSSPRDKETSRIELLYKKSDRRKWWVPCPHCKKHQVLGWKQVVWDRGRDDKGNEVHRPETAAYACEHCGVLWTEAERHAAVAQGEWRAERPFNGTAGFWLNALNSPWQSLPKIVANFLEAKKLPGTLRTFVNTVLAETWEEQGVSTDDEALAARAEAFGEKAPAEVAVITAACDVQDDRLEVEIVGWGRDYESWSLDLKMLPGDPSGPDLWEALGVIFGNTFETEDGRVLPIRAAAVDMGGHHTQQVLNFCKRRWHRRIWAIQGKDRGLGAPVWPGKFSRSRKGKPFFSINVDEAKATITKWLDISTPRPWLLSLPHGARRQLLQAIFRRAAGYAHEKRLPQKGLGAALRPAQRGPGPAGLQLRGPVRPGGHGFQPEPGMRPHGQGSAARAPGRTAATSAALGRRFHLWAGRSAPGGLCGRPRPLFIASSIWPIWRHYKPGWPRPRRPITGCNWARRRPPWPMETSR